MFLSKIGVLLAVPALGSELYAIENWYADAGGGPLPNWRRGAWRVVSVKQPSGELTPHSSWTLYPIAPPKEGGEQGVVSGLFQENTMLIKQTEVPNGGDSFKTWSPKHGVSLKSFDLPLFDVHGNLGQVYGIEYNTTYGPNGPTSSKLNVFSMESPSASGAKKLAELPADTLLASADFTGDADDAYVLVTSYSNKSDPSHGSVVNNLDLWKVPRSGGAPEKRRVGLSALHMLKVPDGPLLVAVMNGTIYDNYTIIVYEVDFDSNKWDVRISGEQFGKPADTGKCAAYDPSVHEWHLGCESIAVIDLNALKVVRRLGVTHEKPGVQGGDYSLSGTAFLPSSAEFAQVKEIMI